MGESSGQIEFTQPKPSRFQFVPVPGEFTRGRWKCRDSYHPYAETLEFEKSKSKEEENPDKISVFFKLKQCDEDAAPSNTIQVTSVESITVDTPEENNTTENIVITRTNGVTIVRKTSCSLMTENYEKIRELSIDDFEHKVGKTSQVPPTPMNTPPATMLETCSGESLVTNNLFFHAIAESSSLEHDKSHFSTRQSLEIQSENTVNGNSEKNENVTASTSEPTFQVIQTEDSKNMSMNSVKNVVDDQSSKLRTDQAQETASDVLITVSAAVERKESLSDAAGSVGILDACGIPITAPPTAPHSTPYGTPKDTQRSPTFDEAFSAGSPVTVAASINAQTTEPSLPIDNKIEQAMELVKTHLTYAVREEVDTLRNTITDLEYQMREYQFECNFYRQNCSTELTEQASTFVRQQMSKYQTPARRSVSTTVVPMDVFSQSSTSNSNPSTHMRNLQNQIQQIKKIVPKSPCTVEKGLKDLIDGAEPI